jgi:hypothetical protein
MANTNANSIDTSRTSLKGSRASTCLAGIGGQLLEAAAMDTHSEGSEALGVGAGVIVDVSAHWCTAATGIGVHLQNVALGGGEEGSCGCENGCKLHDDKFWRMLVVC